MDDRKKKIIELEKLIASNQVSLDSRLEGLGNALLSRPEIGQAAEKTFSNPGILKSIEEYRRLLKEIADSEASIQEVEAQIARLRELEEDIEARGQDETTQARELSGYYKKLGKLVLDDSDLDEFSSAFRSQAEILVPKVQSLEDRLAELTNQTEGGNVFTWIGKSAQGMVLKSFLTKATDSLERLYCNAGEQFFRLKAENYHLNSGADSGIIDVIGGIRNNKSVSAELTEELVKLREERRVIDTEFNAAGGPLKQIQGLKKNIAAAQENLKTLYVRFGEAVSIAEQQAAREIKQQADAGAGHSSEKSETSKKHAKSYDYLIGESEQLILDDIRRLKQAIIGDGNAIEKLKASLAIDEEWEKVDKYRRSIAEKKACIAEAEQSIAEYESRIGSAEKHIEELQQLL